MYEADLALNERVLILQVKLGSALQTECVVPEESLEWQARNPAKGTNRNRTTGQIAEATDTFVFLLFLQIFHRAVTVTRLAPAHHYSLVNFSGDFCL